MNKTSVIIPAAGLATRMKPLSSNLSKSMIPINGKPIIMYILNELKQIDSVAEVIIVDGKFNDIRDFIELHKEKFSFDIRCVRQNKPTGPLDAIKIGAGEMSKDIDSVFIWLGDTILRHTEKFLNFDFDFLLYKEVSDYEKWCMVKYNKTFKKLQYLNKPDFDPKTNMALVGGYYFKDANKFLKSLLKTEGEVEISAVLEEYANDFNLINVNDYWYDCGNLSNYISTRIKFIEELSRKMNRITVDPLRSIVIKESKENPEKIEIEKFWYENVSSEIQSFIPQYFPDESSEGKMVMEWESGISLSDALIFENYSINVWETIIQRIFKILNTYFHHQEPENSLEGDSVLMLNGKTLNRLSEITGHVEYKPGHIKVINDTLNRSFYDPTYSSKYIHGDLHLGNILFDPYNLKFKFIDPRGHWGETKTVSGDKRYDIAKFSQCILGGYAYIINEMYHYDDDGDIKINWSKNYLEIQNILRTEIENAGYDFHEICTFVGLLLISCIPFHVEDSKRVQALWDRGIQILEVEHLREKLKKEFADN